MISLVIILITAGAAYVLKKKNMLPEKKVVILIFFLEGAGCLVSLTDMIGESPYISALPRPPETDSAKEEELFAQYEGKKKEIKVTVSPREVTAEEAEKYFAQAKTEIDESIFKKNKENSPDSVQNDLYVKQSYCGGVVDAAFEFSGDADISSDGKIDFKSVSAPVSVEALVTLTCGEYENIYSFPFMVVPKDASTEDGFMFYLEESLKDADEVDKTKDEMALPAVVSDKDVLWSLKKERTGEKLAILALLAGAGIVFGKKEEEKRSKKKRQDCLTDDYPEIVSKLSLYVGAGLPPKTAFKKMAKDYASDGADINLHPGYEAVIRLSREMEDGLSEMSAYERLGEYTKNKNYRKLSVLLTQNLKKGTAGLSDLLSNEEREAFEMRKTRAKVKGEEASTKLLIPMVGMLLMILVIMMVPALWGMNTQ